jgi:hypothetical protein
MLGLGGQELLPRWPGAARGGVDPGLVQDVPDGRGGDLVAEAGKFTVDASVAPPGIFRGHALDEGLDRSRGRWPSGTATSAVVPLLRHEFAVPGQQGGRGYREDLPPLAAGYQVRERRQPQAVRWFVPHPRDLAA